MTALSQQERSEVRSKDGTMIPVYKSGSGRTLLMVHGGGGNHANWGHFEHTQAPELFSQLVLNFLEAD
jgi:hypothetical protein